MKQIPKNYKTKVEDDKGALRLAGEIIRSLLLDIKCPGVYTREARIARIARVKHERIAFALGRGNPLINSWCDITDYSYSKVMDNILQFNQ